MIQGWHIALMLKPLGLVLMFVPGALVVRYLRPWMPECRLKRILFYSWRV